MSHEAYVHIRDLRVTFRRDGQTVNAVNGVSFDVRKGEVMALINAPSQEDYYAEKLQHREDRKAA